MLENLFNLVKELGQDQVVNNTEVPNEHNEAVIAEATHSIATGLQNGLANGQGQDVVNLLQGQGNASDNPVAQNMQSSFLENITSKLGISPTAAAGLAATFIPMVLSKLTKQTNDPNNSSFDLGGIISSLTGGGGNANTSGGGIGGLISQFTGGAQQQQTQQGSGGLMDIIKGFMH